MRGEDVVRENELNRENKSTHKDDRESDEVGEDAESDAVGEGDGTDSGVD